jgi:hypothetical protein
MAGLVPIVLLATAGLVVKQETPLRAGCEASDEVVARVPAGSPTEIKFAMSGPTETCYKVTVQSAGSAVTGYVPASALQGLEHFAKQVREAPTVSGAVTSSSVMTSATERGKMPSIEGSPNHPLVRASRLLEQRQPRAALELVEKQIHTQGRDYQSLVLAGIAAYQADEMRVALEYLQQSQSFHQDHSVQRMIEKLQQERAGDKSGEKLYGNRFLLRYEGGNLEPDLARSMVGLLEQEFSRIAAQLGCRTDERIVAVVQSWPAYRATTGAAEWSAGQFDGKIRIPVADSKAMDERTRKVFAHELVHACLANLGTWPSWLHEGLAQKLSGETTTPYMRNNLRVLMREKKVPRLENMSQSWSRLSAQHAAAAYALALAAADEFMDMYANFGIANVLRNPSMLPRVTAELDKRLFPEN